MGEVGGNNGENSTASMTINGDMNGSCDEEHDEPMDIDPLESPQSKNDDGKNIVNEDEYDDNSKSNLTDDSSSRLKDNLDDKTQSSIPDDDSEYDGSDDSSMCDDNTHDGKTTERSKNEENIDKLKSNDANSSEIHDIPDSDDEEESKNSTTISSNKNDDVEPMEVDGGKSNGHAVDVDDDDEKPVSINSDSESDVECTNVEIKTPDKSINQNNNKSKNEDCNKDDEEDCIVVEDTKEKEEDISPRRSSRQRKSVVQVRNFADFDDDVEEVVQDPLKTSTPQSRNKVSITPQFTNSNTSLISIKDTRSLVNSPQITPVALNKLTNNAIPSMMSANQNKKEPTLVIIDTNSIMSGRTNTTATSITQNSFSVLPVGVPGQGVYPSNIRSSQQLPPLQPKNLTSTNLLSTISNSVIQNQALLPALTDDMFVLEAPSFIVPYIYEKPPSENLKDIVTKIGLELEEQRKEEEKKTLKDKNKKEDNGEAKIDEDNKTQDAEKDSESQNKTTNGNKEDAKGSSSKSRKNRRNISGDDSWDELDESTDDEASDSEQRTKVLIKEVQQDIEEIKKHIITPETIKEANAATTGTSPAADPNKKENYFESPLGKFFMTIGVNLVQEFVQTDLLRQQKRKQNREGGTTPVSVQVAINSLMKNLEMSREQNEPFKFEMKRCEFCNFKSESSLAMAHHYETPHMKQYVYKCNFCTFETRPPHDILFHMEAVHNIKGRLEKALTYHQCPNCPFEDNGKSKLARHAIVCAKKFRPEANLVPPNDWEPPAKIPRIKPKHGLVGTATAYQQMAAQHQRATATYNQRPTNTAANNLMRNRGAQLPIGRNQALQKINPIAAQIRTNTINRTQIPAGMMMSNNYQISNQYMQTSSGVKAGKNVQQPSISITALPRQTTANMVPSSSSLQKPPPGMKPGQAPNARPNKSNFVICEICDGYIKDLDQLRNHMQWIHKIKIHPKMIYNRPPLNCQKCQFRFFTDQGLERHLLGSHGLVTSSMQEAANKGKDSGRCPVCGRVYQWKLLNHVSGDHNMTLKPAHLSYKCTVCTATFGMYKQFENHVYSAHSTVGNKRTDNRITRSGTQAGSSSSNISGDSLLKPLKINDEITIIPQPASKGGKSMEIESHVID